MTLLWWWAACRGPWTLSWLYKTKYREKWTFSANSILGAGSRQSETSWGEKTCKKKHLWALVLEKTLESPLEIKPVNPKGNQSWILVGRTDAEIEAPIVWPPDAKNWHIRKYPDAGKDWRQEEKGMTEDEMAGWHRWLDGRESEWTPGVGDGQGSLACCSSWGHEESDTTEWLNWYWPPLSKWGIIQP